MSAETDIDAIDDGGANTASEVRTALKSTLHRPYGKAPDDSSLSASPWSWHKADDLSLSDGAAVSTWTDASGNGRSMTGGNNPTYQKYGWPGRTKACVYFDGSNDYKQIGTGVPASGTTGRTIIVVLYPRGNSANLQHIVHWGTASVNQAWGLVMRAGNAFGNHTWSFSSDWDLNHNREPCVIGVRFDGTDNNVFYNGGKWIVTDTPTVNTGTGATIVGSRISPGAEYGRFLLAELVLYGDDLTDEEISDVSNYLATKWSV